MRILYLHQYFTFPDESGGTRSYDLAKRFIEKGIEVEVISATPNRSITTGGRWTVIRRDGITVNYIYLPYGNHMPYWKRSWTFLRFIWFSVFRLLALKGDIVLATSTPLTIGIPALIKKWIAATPFIFEVRDVWPEAVIAIGAIKNDGLKRLLYWLERLIYKNADAIIPLSIDMKKSIVTRYPDLSNKEIVTIENIAEINRFQHNYDPDKDAIVMELGFKPRFSIVYAGTFGRVNGISYVISLAEKILSIDPTIVFILIGDGAEKEDVRKLAESKGVLGTTVFIVDPVKKDDLPQWYFSADMGSSFVVDVKQLWANSANKFFDTLAAGRPILINYEGWQKQIIDHNNLGYVLSQDISDKDVKNFVTYTQNVELQIKQRKNAVQTATRLYALDVAVKKYLNVIRKICIGDNKQSVKYV